MSISSIMAGLSTSNQFFHNGPDILAKQTLFLNNRDLANLCSVDKFTQAVVQDVKKKCDRSITHVEHLFSYFKTKISEATTDEERAIANNNYRAFVYRNFSHQPEQFKIENLLNGDPANSAKVKEIYEDKIYTELWEDFVLTPGIDAELQHLTKIKEIAPSRYWISQNNLSKIQFRIDASFLKFFSHLSDDFFPDFVEQEEFVNILVEASNLFLELQNENDKSIYKAKLLTATNLLRPLLDTKQAEDFFNTKEMFSLNQIPTFENHKIITSEIKHYLLKMKNLKVIDLTGTPEASLTKIPEWITKIPSLQELRLKGNHLLDEDAIPESILSMPNVKVIADFKQIPWSYPRHKLTSVIDTIINLPWVVKLANGVKFLATLALGITAFTGLGTVIALNMVVPLLPFLEFMPEGSIWGLSILSSVLSTLLLRRMMMIANTIPIEEGARALAKIIGLSLMVFGILAFTYCLVNINLPSVIPYLAHLTGYAPDNLYQTLSLSAYTIALIPSYYAVYTSYRDIWNKFAPQE